MVLLHMTRKLFVCHVRTDGQTEIQNDATQLHDNLQFRLHVRPRGLMDKASDFESEDCAFESRRGRNYFSILFAVHILR